MARGQSDLFPSISDWVPPTELPHIPSGTQVAIDTETCDRGLQAGTGPGWVHGEGWLCGVSWAYEGGSGYAPVRHPDTECMDEALVLRWLSDLSRRCSLVFQNASYDMGWTGVVPERPDDVHTMAVLMNENEHSYSLDSISLRLGIPGKDETLLREAVLTHGGNPKRIKEHIWRLPARYVSPYAEQDAVSTLGCAQILLPQIDANGLREAYDLETELSPHILRMRERGIRINVDRLEKNQSYFRELARQELQQVTAILTQRREVTIQDIRSPRWLEATFTDLGIGYPRTAKTGQGQFDKEFLEACPHPIAMHISQARSLHDASEKFLGNYILSNIHMGRIHAEIHQLRDAEAGVSSGTKTYRFSYSNPPLQQMNRAEPDKANPEHKDYREGFIDIGTKVRECFEPESDCVWSAPDYSQQEYRLIVDYSSRLGLPKAEEAVEYYRSDPKADYHNFVVSMTGLVRKKAKDANFAKAFGAGIPKFALMTGMAIDEAEEVMRVYDDRLPFVSKFAKRSSDVAAERGYVRLMDGRRCRFDLWEASWVPKEEWSAGRAAGHNMTECSLEEARRRQSVVGHPWRGKRLKRSGTHKAGNRVIQGGAAVQTKKALLACAREGYLPMIQMHDELGFSHGDERSADRTAEIMRDAVQLRVPTVVDNEHGPDWGRAKYSFSEAMAMVSRS